MIIVIIARPSVFPKLIACLDVAGFMIPISYYCLTKELFRTQTSSGATNALLVSSQTQRTKSWYVHVTMYFIIVITSNKKIIIIDCDLIKVCPDCRAMSCAKCLVPWEPQV